VSADTATDPEPHEDRPGRQPLPPLVLPETVVLIWQSLADRRVAYDTMMWQTPALALTAQAFLLTLALGGQISGLGRAISAGLAAALAITTVQLMAKHRQHEIRDAKLLEQIEREHGFERTIGVRLHSFARPSLPMGIRPAAIGRRFRQYSSFRLWMAGQLSFLTVAAVVLILVVTGNAEVLASR
jgi:hypothetical protein